jgi:hypothetical protein
MPNEKYYVNIIWKEIMQRVILQMKEKNVFYFKPDIGSTYNYGRQEKYRVILNYCRGFRGYNFQTGRRKKGLAKYEIVTLHFVACKINTVEY